VTNWSDEQKSNYSLSIWWDNVTHPQTDSDDLYLNYIVHPYWGSAYYVRAQERGYSRSGSFWYSVLCSSLYEFGAEALFEEASKQDLWITPIVGSAVGVGFMRLRDGVRIRSSARGFVSTGDKWIWVLTDPLGALNRTFDRWFGWDGDVTMRPYAVRQMGLTERLGRLEPSGMEWEAGVLVTARW